MEKKTNKKIRVAVIMGGFSEERHVSLESGRNVFQKLSASIKYEPIALFLSGTAICHRLFVIPINILLKDNADDIHAILFGENKSESEVLALIREKVFSCLNISGCATNFEVKEIIYDDLPSLVDFVFIAVHGHPGEDGTMQAILDGLAMPYNGSGSSVSRLAMNKYNTNQLLKSNGIHVANQFLVSKSQWVDTQSDCIASIEAQLQYPCIAKPVDDGCSAAVMSIKNKNMLIAYGNIIFREIYTDLDKKYIDVLCSINNNCFPQKDIFLIEDTIAKGDANYFLEITVGLLTHFNKKSNSYEYEIFNPSQALAKNTILTLEEKFLVGDGHNITPAIFHSDMKINNSILCQVKNDIKNVATILGIEGYARIDAFVKVYEFNESFSKFADTKQYKMLCNEKSDVAILNEDSSTGVLKQCETEAEFKKRYNVETWIIEVNSLPAMTPATCIFHQCAINGYTPFEFIDHIIEYGIAKNKFKHDAK